MCIRDRYHTIQKVNRISEEPAVNRHGQPRAPSLPLLPWFPHPCDLSEASSEKLRPIGQPRLTDELVCTVTVHCTVHSCSGVGHMSNSCTSCTLVRP
eukprot:6181416-Pyramimonas_sp.AAC.2